MSGFFRLGVACGPRERPRAPESDEDGEVLVTCERSGWYEELTPVVGELHDDTAGYDAREKARGAPRRAALRPEARAQIGRVFL